MTLKITPLGDFAGAEATGVDLREPQDAETCQRLIDAAVEHVALVVRDQTLDANSFAKAVAVFGETMPPNFTAFSHESEKDVSFVSNTFPGKTGERVYHSNYWHTDHTNREEPPNFTALYALELPESGGGDTGIVNMRAAYDRLPDAMKARIDGLKTVNVFQGSASKRKSHRYDTSKRRIDDVPVIHPMVRTHPANGTKAIYMHQGKVENFVGMSPEESQDLVLELLDMAIQPDLTYRHEWRLGDLLIWDDRSTMHKAFANYDLTETRTLLRTLVKGDKPY